LEPINGMLITRADRTLVSKQIEAEVRNYFGPLVYPRAVPASVRFREAYARGIPLIYYDRFSAGAEAYRAVAIAYLAGQDQPALASSTLVDHDEPDLEEDASLREAS
jgi:chromosome partitioning protein